MGIVVCFLAMGSAGSIASTACCSVQGCRFSNVLVQRCEELFKPGPKPPYSTPQKSWKPNEGQIVLGFLIHYILLRIEAIGFPTFGLLL